METIDYPKGCKCAYCNQEIEDPSCSETHTMYKITSTGVLGATWQYTEYEVKVPVCKACSRKKFKHEGPYVAATLIFWVICIIVAFVIAYKNAYSYRFFLGVCYCIPASMVGGLFGMILMGICKLTAPKDTPKLHYPILKVFRHFGFSEKRPSVHEQHFSTDWPEIKDKFYDELEKCTAAMWFNAANNATPVKSTEKVPLNQMSPAKTNATNSDDVPVKQVLDDSTQKQELRPGLSIEDTIRVLKQRLSSATAGENMNIDRLKQLVSLIETYEKLGKLKAFLIDYRDRLRHIAFDIGFAKSPELKQAAEKDYLSLLENYRNELTNQGFPETLAEKSFISKLMNGDSSSGTLKYYGNTEELMKEAGIDFPVIEL